MDAFPTRPKLLLDCGLSRSAVQEIVTVNDLIFVVTRSGVCTVFEEGNDASTPVFVSDALQAHLKP